MFFQEKKQENASTMEPAESKRTSEIRVSPFFGKREKRLKKLYASEHCTGPSQIDFEPPWGFVLGTPKSLRGSLTLSLPLPMLHQTPQDPFLSPKMHFRRFPT
jgi:hypothetical protein